MFSFNGVQVFPIRHASLNIPSHAHRRVPVKLNLLSSEKTINLLQCEVSGFRVEVIDEREETEVED
jgi:hypothetical protein